VRLRIKLFGLNAKALSHLESTLAAVAGVLAEAKKPWWIIGSAAVSLHLKRDISVNDVDVLLSVSDARQVREKLAIPPAAIDPHPLFHSEEYFTWDSQALPTEFMAGFSVSIAGEWQKVICRTRQAFEVAGQMLYAPEIEELALLLKCFGRPKDVERLALLGGGGFSV
jgi:hypothetical protein